MILVDMEMPKSCKECPMNCYGAERNLCGCVYFQIGDMRWIEKQIIMERYETLYDKRPKWCPLKEVKK